MTRNLKTRLEKLEDKTIPKALPIQILTVPKGIPREEWDQWIANKADGRPLYAFPEGLSLEEVIAKVGCVEIYEYQH